MKRKFEKATPQPSYSKSSFMEFLLELNTTEIDYQKLKAFTELNNLANRLYFIEKESGYDGSTLQRVLEFF